MSECLVFVYSRLGGSGEDFLFVPRFFTIYARFLRPLRSFFVFGSACVSVAVGDEAGQGKGAREDAQQKFRIPSSEVYNELMVRCGVFVCSSLVA